MEMDKYSIDIYLNEANHIKSVLQELDIENLNKILEYKGKKYTIDSIDFEKCYVVLLCEAIDEDGDDQSYFTELNFDEYKDKFLS